MQAPTSLEIQAAVIARLRGHAGLAGLVGGSIYDLPKSDEPVPYVFIPSVEFSPINADGCGGGDWLVSLAVVSGHKGKKEVHQISEQIVAALDGQPLAVNGWVMTRQIFKDATTDDPGVMEGGDVRFRITAITIGD